MRRVLYLLVFFFSANGLFAQTDSTAPYWKTRNWPKIDIIRADSSHFTNSMLAKNRKTMIMFFSPTCDHCRHQMTDLMMDIEKFENINIVMASYQPMEDIVRFGQEFSLMKFDNIVLGRDAQFILPPYYKMKSLPYLAFYDEKGKLITSFEGNRKVPVLLDALNAK